MKAAPIMSLFAVAATGPGRPGASRSARAGGLPVWQYLAPLPFARQTDGHLIVLAGGCSRLAIFALGAALGALAFAIGAPSAHAASYMSCALSERDQDPPGGTAAYDLWLTKRNTSCAIAKKVMVAFHRCRGDLGTSCRGTVLASWSCTGKRRATLPLGRPRVFAASFSCASKQRRIRGGYRENSPRCFGAAVRDRKRPCVNPTRTIYPRGEDPHALDEGAAGCHDDASRACVFGPAAQIAKGHFAVVGDSHVLHWRAALNVIAHAYSWRGYSHSAGGCFFSEAVHLFSDGCGAWYRSTASWFDAHPEVTTVFVTANADTPVAVAAGKTSRGIKVDGFKRAFRALPKTVRQVIVLRDTPASSQPTFDCIARVLSAGTERPGQACALARSVGLREDTAVLAARQLRSKRYRVIDMTRYFCGARNCYPVIGGVLVNADIWGHITVSYMRTVGPYLLREFRRLGPGRQGAS